MSKRSEPDDVEFFVGGVEPGDGASIETARIIEEYKKRPDYPIEAEEAERLLAALGIKTRDSGMQDARSLLDHWRRCVDDLKANPGENHEGKMEQENIRVERVETE